MLLDGKRAVIYGGAGAIGSAVARAFAREGAHVEVAGRTLARVEEVAAAIRAAGGSARAVVVDALDEASVERHADEMAAAGGIDVSFNAIGHPYTHGVPLTELGVEEFMAPVEVAARSAFLTARAAARRMLRQRSGVLLFVGGPGERSGPSRDYPIGGTQVAFDAIEALRRQLAVELGPHGIRVVTLALGGIPESLPPSLDDREEIAALIERQTLLGRAATLEDVAHAATFAASDRARAMTGALVNVTAGALLE